MADSVLEGLIETVDRARKRNLSTLIIIGAGVSVADPARVPLLSGMVLQLSRICAQTEPRLFEQLEPLFDHPETDRDKTSRLFSEFQIYRSDERENVWNKFQQWLIRARPEGSDDVASGGNILNCRPTKAHLAIAHLYNTAKVQCVSFNFDGLTHSALSQLLDHRGGARYDRVVLLDHTSALERYFLRHSTSSRGTRRTVAGVIKLNGDILYAVCRDEPACPSFNRPEQVYLLSSDAIGTSTIEAADVLKCRNCKRERRLAIRFPGEAEKDAENKRLLECLWSYLLPNLGCVVTAGLSAKWDDLIVRSLRELRALGTPIFDINPDPMSRIAAEVTSAGAIHLQADEALNSLMSAMDVRSYGGGEAFRLASHLSVPNNHEDRLWEKWLGPLKLTRLEERAATREVFGRLRKRSQLSQAHRFSEVPGRETTRHEHSLGMLHVADFLYQSLRDHRSTLGERRLLRMAALLHDIGHVPFSHLMEEVFEELGWDLSGTRSTFDHAYYTDELIPKLFSELESAGVDTSIAPYTPDDLIKLIQGRLGVPYLDALVNSPIDADKVDYVFRDAQDNDIALPVRPDAFFRSVEGRIGVSPAGFLTLAGDAVSAFTDLLDARTSLYERFYLSPKIRLAEASIKLILTAFALHTLSFDGMRIEEGHDTFGPIKIKRFLDLLEGPPYDGNEDAIIRLAVDQLKMVKDLDDRFVSGIEQAKVIWDSGPGLSTEYLSRLLIPRQQVPDTLEVRDGLKHIRKYISFAFPGALLIDDIRLPARVSGAKARRALVRTQVRLDGTSSGSEVALVDPDPRNNSSDARRNWIDVQKFWPELGKDRKRTLTVYALSRDETYVHHARDQLIKLLLDRGWKVL